MTDSIIEYCPECKHELEVDFVKLGLGWNRRLTCKNCGYDSLQVRTTMTTNTNWNGK